MTKVIASFSGDIVTGALAPVLPAKFSSKWAGNTKNAASEIIDGRTQKVPDALSYQDKVVQPSAAKWNQMLNPSFVSKKGKTAAVIMATRASKMTTSFDKWQTNLNSAFATEGGVEAKKFKDAVDANAATWAQNAAAYNIPFTGTGRTGKGPAIFIQEFLTGNPNYAQLTPSTWVCDAAVDIIVPGMENSFKPMVSGLLVQMMNFAAVTGFDPAVLAQANAKLATAMNALLNESVANPFATPDASPNSSLILSAGESEGMLHVACIVRFDA